MKIHKDMYANNGHTGTRIGLQGKWKELLNSAEIFRIHRGNYTTLKLEHFSTIKLITLVQSLKRDKFMVTQTGRTTGFKAGVTAF